LIPSTTVDPYISRVYSGSGKSNDLSNIITRRIKNEKKYYGKGKGTKIR